MPGPTDGHLRTLLADQDTPCPASGYTLRGLPTARCPEGNQPLPPRAGLAEPRLGAWLAAASGQLAGAGAALVCLMIVAGFMVRWGPPGRREMFAVTVLPVIMLVVEG